MSGNILAILGMVFDHVVFKQCISKSAFNAALLRDCHIHASLHVAGLVKVKASLQCEANSKLWQLPPWS